MTNSSLAIDVTVSMILFDKQLEEWVRKSCENHEFVRKEKSIEASAYFLLGSFCSDGDVHVAHASKCPVHSSALEDNPKAKLLDDEWMADNAERVIRLLPGGIHIVGIAWFSTKKNYEAHKAMINKTLQRIHKMNQSLTTLGLEKEPICQKMASVWFDGATPNATLVELSRPADSPVKTSFQKLEWISLITNASARIVLNVPLKDGKRPDFYRDFVAAIKQFATNMIGCETMLLDGQIRDDNEPLVKEMKKNKKTTIEAQMFIDPKYNRSNECVDEIATNLHEIMFDIEVRAAVPLRSNVKEAKRGLKHHLIRNLCSRAELHYESMEVVEEETPATSSVHQLPRPATSVLYTQPAILLNDFLFEADNIEDAQKNFDDMMDLQTSIEHVDEGWERALTPEEMEVIRKPIEDLKYVEYDGVNDSCCTTRTLLITVAVIIGIIASIIYFTVAHN